MSVSGPTASGGIGPASGPCAPGPRGVVRQVLFTDELPNFDRRAIDGMGAPPTLTCVPRPPEPTSVFHESHFAGTPEFARVALERLLSAGFTVPLVLTQPDRPPAVA